MKHVAYRDEHAIAKVVEKFERCAFGLEEFTHARHLTVASWYLCHLPPDEAQARMSTGLVRFIEHHGKQGYHETITRFWMELIRTFLDCLPKNASIMEKVNKTMELHGNKDVLLKYYTRERVLSEVAGRTRLKVDWVRSPISANLRRDSCELPPSGPFLSHGPTDVFAF